MKFLNSKKRIREWKRWREKENENKTKIKANNRSDKRVKWEGTKTKAWMI